MPSCIRSLAAAAERPLVLLTPDWDDGRDPGVPETYRISGAYSDAVREAGGLALVLSPRDDAIAEAVALAAGIVVTGSAPGIDIGRQRLDFEHRLVGEALRQGRPLLGICHGMQVIGEVLGGSILRNLPALLAPDSVHLPFPAPDRLAHEVSLAPGSRLADWQGGSVARVNSLHRHALGTPGRARVVARAPDGVVEAIEGPGFCLGVQWHPEYRLTALDRAIWRGFVAACAEAPVAVAGAV